MVIEESILIVSPIDKVWNILTDLTCWSKWNTAMANLSSARLRFEEGSRFSFSIRPFVIPVYIQPLIEEVVPLKKITWRLEKFGITAIHEYNFHETDWGISVTSRETFYRGLIALSVILFSTGRLRRLTLTHLTNLKEAAESGKDNGTKD